MSGSTQTPDAPSRDVLFERLQAEISRPPFHRLLGPIAENVDEKTGNVTVRLPYKSSFSYTPGAEYIHGGVISALIDLTAFAAVSIQTKKVVRTIDFRIDYLSPAQGKELVALGAVTKSGRSIGRVDVSVTAGDTVVATGRGTFIKI